MHNRVMVGGEPLRRLSGWLVVPGLLAVFASDAVSPLGLAHGLLYAPVLLLAMASRSQRLLGWSSAAAVLMIGLGAVFSPPSPEGIPHWLPIGNRVLSIVVVLCIGVLGVTIQRWMASLEHALAELDENQRLLEVAGRTGKLGGWSVREPWDRVVWSAEVARLHGVDPSESVAVEDALAFYHPSDRDAIRRDFETCVRDGEPFDSEYRILPRGSDRELWIRTIGRAVRDGSGRIVAVEGAFQDIHRVKSAEQSVAEGDRRLRALADSMPIPVWTATARGEVDFVNGALAALAGGGGAPDWLDLVHPDDRGRCAGQWRRVVAEGTHYAEEARLRGVDGTHRWHLVQGVPIRDAVGAIAYWYCTALDFHERRELEREARDLAVRLEATLESITDAFFTVDRDWRLVFLNRRAEELLHRTRGDLLGRVVWDAFPAAVGTTFQREYERAAATGESVRFEEYFGPLEMWFTVSAYPSPQGLAVYFRDNTEARRRDQQLRLLEAAVARLNDLVVITEAEPISEPGPRIVYVNDAFERRTGYTREEVIGRSPRFLQGPRTQRDALDRIRDSLKRWKPIREELVNYAKDGTEFWLELEIVPLADETGWYTHWVSIERDVTERKRAEEALRASQERLTLILDSMGEGVHGIDGEGRVLFQNRAAETMFGWRQGEAGGRDSHDLLHHHHADGRAYPRTDCPILATLRDGSARRVDGEVFFRRDGTSFPVEYTCSPMRNAGGEVAGAVVTFRDVTAQRVLEEQLRQSHRLEAVGKLTGGMAHDFNNLLTVILGNAELLVELSDDASGLRPLAEMILMASRRGADLTHRLLAFARRQPLDPEPVDVNALCAELEPLMRRTLGGHIEVELRRGAGVWEAMVDRAQLESALLNLAINSRDAMPGGGRLVIETENIVLGPESAPRFAEFLPGEYVMVGVSDTGTGMEPEVLERVFEPFFTTKPTGQGTGLGLSMVYGFVKQSRGHVTVDSALGRGTTIRLYLPRAVGASGDSREVRVLPAGPVRPASATILLVEDDELVRQFAGSLLRSLGYTVLVAETGPAALEILRGRGDVDLLFTDVVMPGGMNGRQLADAARLMYPALRVLYASGYTDDAIMHQGRLDPDAHLLGKPYGRAELEHKIREVLESPA